MQVLVAHLACEAVDFREVDYCKPTALIFGQEKSGVSKQAIAAADHNISIPMMGMVQSLNVSVAAALILYEAQHQRELAGMYEQQSLDESICQDILFERGYPRIHKHCLRKKLPYPRIGTQGEIIADKRWWLEMQLSPEALSELEQEER